MSDMPVLFSPTRSTIASLPTLPYSTFTPLGNVYHFANRAWLCTKAGTTSSFLNTTTVAYRNALAASANSTTFTPLFFGTAEFRDITGHPNYGWERAIGSHALLFSVTNPTISAMLRPTFSANTVLVDSDTVVEMLPTSAKRDSGIAMWAYFDAAIETFNGSSSYPSGTTIAHPTPDGHFSYISTDATLPAMPGKKGATFRFLRSPLGYVSSFGGYGYLEGIIFDLDAIVEFSGAVNTICYLWFENCEIHLRYQAYCDTEGNKATVGSLSTLIDLMFSRTPITFYPESKLLVAGKVRFENTTVSRTTDMVPIQASTVWTEVSAVGVDFSGIYGDSPIIDLGNDFCPMLEVKYEGCIGLRTTHITSRALARSGNYRIEVIGGELDGVLDQHRYMLFTNNYSMSVVYDTYAASSASAPAGGLASYRFDILQPGALPERWQELQLLSAWAEPGIYEVSVLLLLPDGLDPTGEDLWIDVSSTGTTRGHTGTTHGTAPATSPGDQWVKPGGFTPHEITVHVPHEAAGFIVATLISALSDVTLYISNTLHTKKVA